MKVEGGGPCDCTVCPGDSPGFRGYRTVDPKRDQRVFGISANPVNPQDIRVALDPGLIAEATGGISLGLSL